jgi:hypothetical protein
VPEQQIQGFQAVRGEDSGEIETQDQQQGGQSEDRAGLDLGPGGVNREDSHGNTPGGNISGKKRGIKGKLLSFICKK